MGLTVALTDKPPTHTKRGSCGVEKMRLTDDELQILTSWLGQYSDQSISDRLAEEGHNVSGQVIRRHRLKNCGCFR